MTSDTKEAKATAEAILALADDYARKYAAGLGWAPSARDTLQKRLLAALATPQQAKGDQPSVDELMALVDKHGACRWATGAAEQSRHKADAKKFDDRAVKARDVIRAAASRLAGQGEQTCGVCGESQAFTGACGGGRDNPEGVFLYAHPPAGTAAAAEQQPLTREARTALAKALNALEVLDARPRPPCRDCADEDGMCPTSGLPCDVHSLLRDCRAILAGKQAPAGVAVAPALLTLDQRYWLDRRAAIIEALRAEGFEICSDKERVWLRRIAGVPATDGGQQ